jgi:small subunit ribosomal protein S1
MTELAKSGGIVEAEVVEADRGGLVVDLGLRGFVPYRSSPQWATSARASAPRSRRRFATTVGKRLPFKVIEADQRRDRLILSEKAAAQQLRRRRKEEASSHSRRDRPYLLSGWRRIPGPVPRVSLPSGRMSTRRSLA